MCEHLVTKRDLSPLGLVTKRESVYGEAGRQSRQHMQPGTASMHCNQSMYADRPNCSGIQAPGGLAGGEPHGIVERSLHKMSGQHCTQGWRGPRSSRSFCDAGVFTGDDEEAWRALQFKRTRWPHLLLLCPCMQQFDVGCDGGSGSDATDINLMPWKYKTISEFKLRYTCVKRDP